ncbi:MAG TPA: sialidase family protein [Frankiaceae bacterium]|nr:sialidase family protein [Frankiaceae bacterium]
MRRFIAVAASGAAIMAVTVAGAAADVGPLTRASGPSPFADNCNVVPQTGTLYKNAEVEPFVATNPRRPRNLVAVWQQDRFSNGGAQGLLARVSRNGGRSWTPAVSPPFSACAGGNPRNNGDYERTSDPWVTFSPDGSAYFMSLSFDNERNNGATNAVVVARSRDGGETWGPITTLIRDTNPRFFNDKNSITADPTDSRYAYAVWDRLDTPDPSKPDNFTGPTYFTRTTNGGASWEPARSIFEPGQGNQTIGNQIAVLPDGTLVDVFAYIIGNNLNVAVQRSTDKGRTWSEPVVVDQLGTIGVVDPRDGAPVRTGDIIPDVAVDPRPGHDDVYVVWQDARFTSGRADQVAFARSGDGGRTWSAAKRVSAPNAAQAFTASVDVDGRGNVGVSYYDFTFDTPASIALSTDYWLTRSTNGGRTFAPRQRVTPTSFNLRTAPISRGFFVGDYQGFASTGPRSTPVFVTANDGDLTNRTDVFSATVGPPFPAAKLAGPRTAGAGRTSGRTLGQLPAGPAFAH